MWRRPRPLQCQRDNVHVAKEVRPMHTLEHDIKAGRVHNAMSFNQKVWALTAQIPAGQVTTYAEIARRLESKGYRAVGNALNRNPYAPAVPCHRVVGSNGSLTGFAGGIEMKRKLLAGEGVEFDNGKVKLPREVR